MLKTFRSNLAMLLLRIGIGTVFLLFGIDKLPHPANWLIYFPTSFARIVTGSGWLTVYRCLWLQGVVEAILGVQLLLGILTRGSAVGCALLLTGIICGLGPDQFWQISVRDIGLLFSAVAIACRGPGDWSVDAWLHRQRQVQERH